MQKMHAHKGSRPGDGVRRWLRPLGAAGAIIAGLAVATAPAAAQSPRKVILGVPSAVSISTAPLVMPTEMGFFKEAGLELEIVVLSGDGTMIPQLANGGLTFAWSGPETLITARQPGKDYLPIKLFYNHHRTYIYEIVVPEGSAIKTVSDLRGQKLGIGAFTWGAVLITRTILKENGLEPGKDVEFVAVGVGAPAFQAFTSGQINALNLYDTMHATMESRGAKIRRLPLPERYADLPTNGFAAHADAFQKDRALLVSFGKAMAMGTVACKANVKACVQAVWKRYPQIRPTSGNEETNLTVQATILEQRLDKMLRFPAGVPARYGEFPREVWEAYTNILFEAGQIATKDVDYDTMYTNDLVADMNTFDVEKVRQQARALPVK